MLATVSLFLSVAFAADVQIPHQGRLTDVGGAPLQGTYGLTFTLYDDPVLSALENLAFTQNFSNQPVDDGYFTVVLGSAPASLDSTVFNQDLWLDIEVDGQSIGPRQPLHEVPRAAHAFGLTLSDVVGACGTEIGEGTLRYRDGALELCNGSDWTEVSSGRKDGSTATKAAETCATLHESSPELVSGTYWLDPEGGTAVDAFQAYCDMATNGGGWTLIMKLRDDTVFQWTASYWTTDNVLNTNDLDLNTDTNAKYASFNRVEGSQLMYYRPGVGQFMQYNFGTQRDSRARFSNGEAHQSTEGNWRPPESRNNTSNAQCNSFTSQSRGVNHSQSCDSVSNGSRARLGEGYEQAGVAHCIWGLGTLNNPCSAPTSGNGSPGGNMRLFVR